MIKAIATMPDIILYLLDSELKACHRVATISDREPIDRSGARTKRGEAWSSSARRVNICPRRAAAGSSRQAADWSVSAFVIPRSSRCCRPKRRRPVHFLVTRQRRSVASVAAIFGRIASRDRSTRQRNFGIEAAPLRSQHRDLTKGLSSHHSLGKGND